MGIEKLRILKRYEEMRLMCLRIANLHPDDKSVCGQALARGQDRVSVSMVMLADDMKLAIESLQRKLDHATMAADAEAKYGDEARQERDRLKRELEEARKDAERLQSANAEMQRNYHADVRVCVTKARQVGVTYRVAMVCAQRDGNLEALPILRTERSGAGIVVIVGDAIDATRQKKGKE